MGCIIGRSQREASNGAHVNGILMIINRHSSLKSLSSATSGSASPSSLISMLANQGRRALGLTRKSVKIAHHCKAPEFPHANEREQEVVKFRKRKCSLFSQQDQGIKSRRKMFSPRKLSSSTDGQTSSEFTFVNAPASTSNQPSNSTENLVQTKDQVFLITSFQQLCHQVIGEQILSRQQQQQEQEKILCLFMFGCQGSSKGELSFELAQHSNYFYQNLQSTKFPESPCPRYFVIDAAALIVANIDARISEYNLLKTQTLQVRTEQQQQLRSSLDKLEVEQVKNYQDNESITSMRTEGRDSSVCSNASLDKLDVESCKSNELASQGKEFAQVTLNTKQRSILQLKLVQYFNCITSRWVISLIHREIKRLEETRIPSTNTQASDMSQRRIYLVNLVPDQLSLFKSCLYLEQNLCLKELGFPFYALQFEKTTSIKLMRKEKPDVSSGSKRSPKHSLKFGNIKLAVTAGLASGSQQQNKLQESARKKAEQNSLVVQSATLIANSITDKLGLKYTEHFVEQFKSLDQLIRVRYNPTRDYNYATREELDEMKNSRVKNLATNLPCSRYLSNFNESSSTSCEQRANKNPSVPIPLRVLSSQSKDNNQHTALAKVSTTTCQRVANLSPEQKSSAPSSRASSLVSCNLTNDESELNWTEATDSNRSSKIKTIPNAIKCTVELQLFDSTEKSVSISGSKIIAGETVKGYGSCTKGEQVIFHQKSSQMLSSQIVKSSQDYYRLLPVRIVYPNGQTQIKFEVKQIRKRFAKLKSQADLVKLKKRIAKAKIRLSLDCNEWLYAAISGNSSKNSLDPSKQHSSSFTGRSSTTSLSNSNPFKVTLIVYTIKVDIHYLKTGQYQFPLDCQLPISTTSNTPSIEKVQSSKSTHQRSGKQLVPILILNNGNSKESISPDLKSFTEKRNRHVQFHLKAAPSSIDKLDDELTSLKAEKRLWLEDNVFISACYDEVSNCSLIDHVAALLKAT